MPQNTGQSAPPSPFPPQGSPSAPFCQSTGFPWFRCFPQRLRPASSLVSFSVLDATDWFTSHQPPRSDQVPFFSSTNRILPSSNTANSVHLFILCSSLCWLFFPVGILLQFSFLRAYCFFGCRYSKLFSSHSCLLFFLFVGTDGSLLLIRAYFSFSCRHFASDFPHSCLFSFFP